MAYKTPGMSDGKDAGVTGVKQGGALAAGEVLGRMLAGAGTGTAIGGIAVAAAQNDGTARDTMATLAINRAIHEVMG